MHHAYAKPGHVIRGRPQPSAAQHSSLPSPVRTKRPQWNKPYIPRKPTAPPARPIGRSVGRSAPELRAGSGQILPLYIRPRPLRPLPAGHTLQHSAPPLHRYSRPLRPPPSAHCISRPLPTTLSPAYPPRLRSMTVSVSPDRVIGMAPVPAPEYLE